MTHTHTPAAPTILALSPPTRAGAYRVLVTYRCPRCAWWDEFLYDTRTTGRFRDHAGMVAVYQAQGRGQP